VIELQSYEFHAHRQAFERDNSKLARLQVAGYEVLPLTHRQLAEESDWVVGALCSVLDRRLAEAA
jgi:very-short-patch-repair endonuclease